MLYKRAITLFPIIFFSIFSFAQDTSKKVIQFSGVLYSIDSPHIEEAIESISFVRQQYEGKIYYLINPNEILLESIQHLPTH